MSKKKLNQVKDIENKKDNPVASEQYPIVGRSKMFLIIGSIVLITFLSFSPATKNSFINQDDDIYVFNNPHLDQSFFGAVSYFFEPHYFAGNYIPLTMISYSIAYHWAGTNPGFYHTLSLFIHILNVILVFWFIYLLSRKKVFVAAIVSLFFGIHPMHVESVAWVAELKDVLYSFFFIAGLIAYYKYIELNVGPVVNLKTKKRPLALLVFGCFIFSILSKPSAIVFPIILLLLDFYTGQTFNKKIWLEKLPLFIVSFIFGVIAIKAQHADNLISYQYTFAQKFVFASYAFLNYLSKFLLPVNLSFFYPYPLLAHGHVPLIYYITPAIVIILFFGIYRSLRYTRIIAFGSAFFFINIALTLQFISLGNSVIADRYTYVSYIGLLFITAMGIDHMYQHIKLKGYHLLTIAIIGCLVITCSFLTYSRCSVWHDEETIVDDILRNYPNDPIPLNNKGYLLLTKQDYNSAITLFKKAIQYKPDFVKADYIKAYINLTNAYLTLKDTADAIHTIDDALQYAPHDFYIVKYKGYLLLITHQYSEAIKYYTEVIQLKKDFIDAYINLARSFFYTKDYDNSIKTLDTALNYDPDNYILLNNKGYDLFIKGDYPKAIACFKASLKIKPDYTTASLNLSDCYHAMNDSMRVKN